MSLVDIRYTPDHALSVTVPNRNSWNFQSVFISNMVKSNAVMPFGHLTIGEMEEALVQLRKATNALQRDLELRKAAAEKVG